MNEFSETSWASLAERAGLREAAETIRSDVDPISRLPEESAVRAVLDSRLDALLDAQQRQGNGNFAEKGVAVADTALARQAIQKIHNCVSTYYGFIDAGYTPAMAAHVTRQTMLGEAKTSRAVQETTQALMKDASTLYR